MTPSLTSTASQNQYNSYLLNETLVGKNDDNFQINFKPGNGDLFVPHNRANEERLVRTTDDMQTSCMKHTCVKVATFITGFISTASLGCLISDASQSENVAVSATIFGISTVALCCECLAISILNRRS
ncbi:MAG: hypothetical protein R3E91_03065 [Chlamydiales bacterium]